MTRDTALFIDADNVTAALADEAMRQLRKAGAAVSIRRAYGGDEKLGGMKDMLRRHAFKAFINHGKGTTDVALVVDVMDLLHAGALPDEVTIASSDADFAALAVRLREAGIRTVCFAHRQKSDEPALGRVYDEVVYDDMVLPVPAGVPASATMASVPAPVAPPVAVAKVPAPAPAPGSTEDVEQVRRILAVFPKWLPNTVRQLNQLGAPLRDAKIKTGNRPLHELFRKSPSFFKVMPATGPAKQVKLLQRPPAH
ncbi:NYN domain-containing protein [Xenophilus arseniciresistens]|uniref:NYN domain-containing protein n=1 Tax=Xenophilus arseniciresistens TaxID=1283306 RepID=A0AAE3NAL0_9BURK|nr:NYN domain-containing protein [Xenophilus arseniciresistens]MDA7417848.1 NYN domain-containing protein [Xenophilus arseniciresistens]